MAERDASEAMAESMNLFLPKTYKPPRLKRPYRADCGDIQFCTIAGPSREWQEMMDRIISGAESVLDLRPIAPRSIPLPLGATIKEG